MGILVDNTADEVLLIRNSVGMLEMRQCSGEVTLRGNTFTSSLSIDSLRDVVLDTNIGGAFFVSRCTGLLTLKHNIAWSFMLDSNSMVALDGNAGTMLTCSRNSGVCGDRQNFTAGLGQCFLLWPCPPFGAPAASAEQ
mmetsp:Transcript_72552/g.183440  ORF Transcript_72552/g.183440 Transcript_72552/m.183440 type:complete len:138 (+) Transcript_72552:1-414(+)